MTKKGKKDDICLDLWAQKRRVGSKKTREIYDQNTWVYHANLASRHPPRGHFRSRVYFCVFVENFASKFEKSFKNPSISQRQLFCVLKKIVIRIEDTALLPNASPPPPSLTHNHTSITIYIAMSILPLVKPLKRLLYIIYHLYPAVLTTLPPLYFVQLFLIQRESLYIYSYRFCRSQLRNDLPPPPFFLPPRFAASRQSLLARLTPTRAPAQTLHARRSSRPVPAARVAFLPASDSLTGRPTRARARESPSLRARARAPWVGGAPVPFPPPSLSLHPASRLNLEN
jgi:hypothetical protein